MNLKYKAILENRKKGILRPVRMSNPSTSPRDYELIHRFIGISKQIPSKISDAKAPLEKAKLAAGHLSVTLQAFKSGK